MDKMLKIAELLGEENVQKLKDGITEMLLDAVKSDFDDATKYDYIINFEELFEEVREEAFANIKDKLVKKYTSEIESRFEELFQKNKQDKGAAE